MDSQPRLRLNPEVLYPPMPEHVQGEIVDLLADAILADLQENQDVRSNMVVSPSGNHHNQRESDEGILRDLLNQ